MKAALNKDQECCTYASQPFIILRRPTDPPTITASRSPAAVPRAYAAVCARLIMTCGLSVQAMAWYRAEPIPAFGGRTAEALVKSGSAAAVRDYLDHLATGGYA